MMILVRTVAVLHLIVYAGIIWYGWQSYKTLRKRSWTFIGLGFLVFFLYRASQLTKQMVVDYPIDTESTLVPFLGSVLLLIGFWVMDSENREFIKRLADPIPSLSGAQPVEYWLNNFRTIFREEIATALKGFEERLNRK